MTNAFLDALLTVAAEERAKAERQRSLIIRPLEGLKDVPWYVAICARMDRELENTAREHEGRAEVYERFANRLIGEIAGGLLTAEVFATLSGEADLLYLERPIPFEFEYAPRAWQIDYGYRLYQPPLPSMLITGTQ